MSTTSNPRAIQNLLDVIVLLNDKQRVYQHRLHAIDRTIRDLFASTGRSPTSLQRGLRKEVAEELKELYKIRSMLVELLPAVSELYEPPVTVAYPDPERMRQALFGTPSFKEEERKGKNQSTVNTTQTKEEEKRKSDNQSTATEAKRVAVVEAMVAQLKTSPKEEGDEEES